MMEDRGGLAGERREEERREERGGLAGERREERGGEERGGLAGVCVCVWCEVCGVWDVWCV